MVVFGLGNPGAKYKGTRHNAGFETVERIAAQKGIKLRKRCFRLYRRAVSGSLVLIEPLTYMNSSGDVAAECIPAGETVIVVVDQMDLPPGKVRIRRDNSTDRAMVDEAEKKAAEAILSLYEGEPFERVAQRVNS